MFVMVTPSYGISTVFCGYSLSLLYSVVSHVNHHCALSHHIRSNQTGYALKK
jgi:hypothetical protein